MKLLIQQADATLDLAAPPLQPHRRHGEQIGEGAHE
jgi:hypothetical protein